MHARTGLVLLFTTLSLLAATPRTAAADEVECELSLSTARHTRAVDHRIECYVGEALHVRGSITNVDAGKRSFPRPEHKDAALHLRDPAGRVFIFQPADDEKGGPRGRQWQALSPGHGWSVTHARLRLAEQSIGDWIGAATCEPVRPSLGFPGEYELWIKYVVLEGHVSATPAAGAPPPEAPAWVGSVESNRVTLIVREFPPDKLRAEPTAEQFRDVDEYLSDDFQVSQRAYTRLERQIVLAENDGLARHLIRVARERPDKGGNLMFLCAVRCGTPWDFTVDSRPALDGPYLKDYTVALLDILEGRQAFGGTVSELPQVGPGLLYLWTNPDDAAIRDRWIVLAKRDANVPDATRRHALQPTSQPVGGDRRCLPISLAWDVLISQRVLHDMPLAEAEAILGPATIDARSNVARWAVKWYKRSMPPALTATLKDGRLSEFEHIR